jgi:surface protein
MRTESLAEACDLVDNVLSPDSYADKELLQKVRPNLTCSALWLSLLSEALLGLDLSFWDTGSVTQLANLFKKTLYANILSAKASRVIQKEKADAPVSTIEEGPSGVSFLQEKVVSDHAAGTDWLATLECLEAGFQATEGLKYVLQKARLTASR